MTEPTIERVREMLDDANLPENRELIILQGDLAVIELSSGLVLNPGYSDLPAYDFLTGKAADPDWSAQVLPLVLSALDLARLCLALHAQLQQEREGREKLAEALEWYGETSIYVDEIEGRIVAMIDRGALARAALAQQPGTAL